MIRARIRRRASNRCERCGVPNGAYGGRLKDGTFLPAVLEEAVPGTYAQCVGTSQWLRIIRIVCTTAHLNHMPEDCHEDNLRFWCQRCHLRYDLVHHQQNARQTRKRAKVFAREIT